MRRFDPQTDPLHHAMLEIVLDRDLKTIKIHPALYKAMAGWAGDGPQAMRKLAESAIAFYLEPTGNGT